MTLRILLHDDLNQDDVDRFVNGILEKMGKISIQVEKVPEIERQASGKLRTSIREFPL